MNNIKVIIFCLILLCGCMTTEKQTKSSIVGPSRVVKGSDGIYRLVTPTNSTKKVQINTVDEVQADASESNNVNVTVNWNRLGVYYSLAATAFLVYTLMSKTKKRRAKRKIEK